MAFEVFDREMELPDGGDSAVAQAMISISGQIVLNEAAKRALEKLRPSVKLVELLYDRDTRQVAVRPVNSSTEGSKRFAVSVARSVQWPRIIESREFVEFWKMPKGPRQAYQVTVGAVAGSGGQVLLFDLREANGQAA